MSNYDKEKGIFYYCPYRYEYCVKGKHCPLKHICRIPDKPKRKNP